MQREAVWRKTPTRPRSHHIQTSKCSMENSETVPKRKTRHPTMKKQQSEKDLHQDSESALRTSADTFESTRRAPQVHIEKLDSCKQHHLAKIETSDNGNTGKKDVPSQMAPFTSRRTSKSLILEECLGRNAFLPPQKPLQNALTRETPKNKVLRGLKVISVFHLKVIMERPFLGLAWATL